jgi:cyanophycinase
MTRRLLGTSLLLISALVFAPRAATLTTALGPSAAMATAPEYGPPNGTLFIGGGSTNGLPIALINKFIELGGGVDGRFVIVPTANGNFDATGQPLVYVESQVISPWLSRGLKHVKMLHTHDPAIANTAEFANTLSDATAVWFTGGRHLHIADSYAGTLTYTAFHKVLERGGVIGGSSAGATIQGEYMVRADTRRNTIMMTDEPNHQKGFNFLRKSTIDQHIDIRNRWDDLIPVIQTFPNLLGIGISEDTAIVVNGDRFEVMGNSKVSIHDNTRQYDRDEKPYYLLSAGDTYDMRTRQVVNLRHRPPTSVPAGTARPRSPSGGVVQASRPLGGVQERDTPASAPPVDTAQPAALSGTTVGPPKSAAISAFRLQLRADVAADKVGGITAAVVIGDHMVWAEAFGRADSSSKRVAGVDTIYRIGSVTKTMTAVVLSQLVDRNTIALDDPVETYLPEVHGFTGARPGATPITFRQLASHTAGLIREPTLAGAGIGPIALWKSKVLACIPTTSFDALPGERYLYSNIGYGVLGLALERAAGRPFMTLVEDGIFTPLGMTSSTFIINDELQPRLSVGYANRPTGIDTEFPASQHVERGYKVPSGGVYSTVRDLARFIGALDGAGSTVTSAAMRLGMRTKQTPEAGAGGYGLGLALYASTGAAPLAGHSGGVAGYTSHIVFDPESKIGVILLRNYETGRTDLEAAANQLVRSLIQETKTPSVRRPSTSAPIGTARPRSASGGVVQESRAVASALPAGAARLAASPGATVARGQGSGVPPPMPIELPRLLERLLMIAGDDRNWSQIEVIDLDLDGEIDLVRIHLSNGETMVWEIWHWDDQSKIQF